MNFKRNFRFKHQKSPACIGKFIKNLDASESSDSRIDSDNLGGSDLVGFIHFRKHLCKRRHGDRSTFRPGNTVFGLLSVWLNIERININQINNASTTNFGRRFFEYLAVI